jgi:hypothetical protein
MLSSSRRSIDDSWSTRPAKKRTHRPAAHRNEPEPPIKARAERGGLRGLATPSAELLHRREAHQTGREGCSAVGADAIRTARESGKEGAQARGGEGDCNCNHFVGAFPPPPTLHTNTAVGPHSSRPTSRRPTSRREIISGGKYSGYSGRPTPTSQYYGAGRPILWGLAPGS